MILFFVLIVLVLVGLTTAAVLGKIGGFLADATTSRSFSGLPPGRLSTQDVEELHFDQALRGYRMDEVDEVLDALCARVSELESEVAALSGGVGPSSATGGPTLAAGDSDDVGSEPQEQ